jgi:hypothetical protein
MALGAEAAQLAEAERGEVAPVRWIWSATVASVTRLASRLSRQGGSMCSWWWRRRCQFTEQYQRWISRRPGIAS